MTDALKKLIVEAIEIADERREKYANLCAMAERRGPSFPGYVTDSSFHHWAGIADAYGEMARELKAKLAETDLPLPSDRKADG